MTRRSYTPIMPDSDLQNRKPRERSFIDMAGSPELLRYWMTDLGCTDAALRAAVALVGTGAEDVRAHLRRTGL